MKPLHFLIALSAWIAAIPVATGVVVYEGFDYSVGDLTGNGGTNWSGAWSIADDGSTGDGDHSIDVVSPGATFTNLDVTGNRASRLTAASHNRAIAYRSINSGVATTLTSGSEMWFSVLIDPNGSSEDFSLIFSDTRHNVGGSDPPLLSAGQALGLAVINNNINAVRYNNSTSQSVSSTTLTSIGSAVHLIVGHIEWDFSGSTDRISLYNLTDADTPQASLGTAFSTAQGDFTQGNFDLISIWDRPTQVTGFDEIRLATTYNEALAIPEPSSLVLLSLGSLLLARRRRH